MNVHHIEKLKAVTHTLFKVGNVIVYLFLGAIALFLAWLFVGAVLSLFRESGTHFWITVERGDVAPKTLSDLLRDYGENNGYKATYFSKEDRSIHLGRDAQSPIVMHEYPAGRIELSQSQITVYEFKNKNAAAQVAADITEVLSKHTRIIGIRVQLHQNHFNCADRDCFFEMGTAFDPRRLPRWCGENIWWWQNARKCV
jgi:hypothetical protein